MSGWRRESLLIVSPAIPLSVGETKKKTFGATVFQFSPCLSFLCRAFSGSTLCEDDSPGCDNSGQENDFTNCSTIRWWMQRLLVVFVASVSVVFGFDWNIKLVFVLITSLSRVPSKVLQRDWIELFDCSRVNSEERFSWIVNSKGRVGETRR